MNYKIIKYEAELQKFINWLPELQDGECYYFSLLARKKYNPIVNTDKCQLKRFTVTKKSYIIEKLKQLETEVGNYFINNIPIPQNALVVYISINPRSQVVAAKTMIKSLVDKITTIYNGYNIHSEALNCLQVSKARTNYVDFDYDGKEVDFTVEEIYTLVNEDAVQLIRTLNGCHILVNPNLVSPEFKKSWYQNISKLQGIDVKGDNLVPVPGCVQGSMYPIMMK